MGSHFGRTKPLPPSSKVLFSDFSRGLKILFCDFSVMTSLLPMSIFLNCFPLSLKYNVKLIVSKVLGSISFFLDNSFSSFSFCFFSLNSCLSFSLFSFNNCFSLSLCSLLSCLSFSFCSFNNCFSLSLWAFLSCLSFSFSFLFCSLNSFSLSSSSFNFCNSSIDFSFFLTFSFFFDFSLVLDLSFLTFFSFFWISLFSKSNFEVSSSWIKSFQLGFVGTSIFNLLILTNFIFPDQDLSLGSMPKP